VVNLGQGSAGSFVQEIARRLERKRLATVQARSLQGTAELWSEWGDKLYSTPGGFSYEEIRDITLSNPVLCVGIRARAGMAVDSGYYIEQVSGERARSRVARELRRWADDHLLWRAGGGLGGLCQVIKQMLIDRHSFGCGFLELLPPAEQGVAYGTRRNPLVAGVAHLSRMNVRVLRPEKRKIELKNGRYVTQYDPDDLLFPRLVYVPSGVTKSDVLNAGNIRFLKAFGDPRKINAYTGKVDPHCAWEEEATYYLRSRVYVPGYEEGCPEWWCALSSLDVVDACSEYFRHILRNNAVPDLMVVVKGATIDEDYVTRMENKFRKLRQRWNNLDSHVNVIVWSLVDDRIGDDDYDGEPPDMDMEWERLNPIDGNTVRALMELKKREELKIAATLRIPSQFLNYERNTGIGSGAEIMAALHAMTRLVIGPDQEIVNALLRRIVAGGRGIKDYVLRLEQPSYNDPETEAKIARMWSLVSGLTIDEIRDKIGVCDLREAMRPSSDAQREGVVDVGKIIVMPSANAALSIGDLEKIIASVFGPSLGDASLSSDRFADMGTSPADELPEGTTKERLRGMLKQWFQRDAERGEELTAERAWKIAQEVRQAAVDALTELGLEVEVGA
jgi:hypothetical protein